MNSNAYPQIFVSTKYLGQTNYRPSRIKATNVNTGKSVTVSWSYDLDTLGNHEAAARRLLVGGESARLAYSSTPGGGYIFTACAAQY